MYLKAMSSESLADHNGSKGYTMYEGKVITFYRCGRHDGDPSLPVDVNPIGFPGYPFADVDGIRVRLEGNAYLLNANGKTIDSFSFISYGDSGAALPAHPTSTGGR